MTEDDDIDGLAAEYVLGSLDPAERRQVDARRQTDALLAAAVAAWERRLAPLSERGRDAAPPAHLFAGILAHVSGQAGAGYWLQDPEPVNLARPKSACRQQRDLKRKAPAPGDTRNGRRVAVCPANPTNGAGRLIGQR
jgi:anti-sigma factor RsiW